MGLRRSPIGSSWIFPTYREVYPSELTPARRTSGGPPPATTVTRMITIHIRVLTSSRTVSSHNRALERSSCPSSFVGSTPTAVSAPCGFHETFLNLARPPFLGFLPRPDAWPFKQSSRARVRVSALYPLPTMHQKNINLPRTELFLAP